MRVMKKLHFLLRIGIKHDLVLGSMNPNRWSFFEAVVPWRKT